MDDARIETPEETVENAIRTLWKEWALVRLVSVSDSD
jgi:hypothetical protein